MDEVHQFEGLRAANDVDCDGDHISHHFNGELMGLKTEFLEMGGLVESQVDRAIQALVNSDSQLCEEVRAGDKRVDRIEIDQSLIHMPEPTRPC